MHACVYACVCSLFISLCNFGNTQITGLVTMPFFQSEEFAWILCACVYVSVIHLPQTDLIFPLYHRMNLTVETCLLQLTHINAPSCCENAVTSPVSPQLESRKSGSEDLPGAASTTETSHRAVPSSMGHTWEDLQPLFCCPCRAVVLAVPTVATGGSTSYRLDLEWQKEHVALQKLFSVSDVPLSKCTAGNIFLTAAINRCTL